MKLYLLAAIILWLFLASLAIAQDGPATILIETDGDVATVQVRGTDAYYPGPSQVTLEHDAFGVVVVVRARLLAVFDHALRLPVVMR